MTGKYIFYECTIIIFVHQNCNVTEENVTIILSIFIQSTNKFYVIKQYYGSLRAQLFVRRYRYFKLMYSTCRIKIIFDLFNTNMFFTFFCTYSN